MSELGADVIGYISHATQSRLLRLLERVSQVAQLKKHQPKVTLPRATPPLAGWLISAALTAPYPPSGRRAARAGERRARSAPIL